LEQEKIRLEEEAKQKADKEVVAKEDKKKKQEFKNGRELRRKEAIHSLMNFIDIEAPPETIADNIYGAIERFEIPHVGPVEAVREMIENGN